MTTVRLLLIATAVLASACAPIPAYQRGLLQSPLMRPATALEEGMDHHVDATREVMTGANGAGGASCGCT